MMLDHLGHPDAGAEVLAAVEATLDAGVRTPDLGGTATTTEVADAVLEHLATGAITARTAGTGEAAP